MGIDQWRELVKRFKTYQEADGISVSEAAWRKLGKDHGGIKYGTWHWEKKKSQRKELVKWWTIDAADYELSLRLTDFEKSRANFHLDQIETISAIYAGDHGKDHT